MKSNALKRVCKYINLLLPHYTFGSVHYCQYCQSEKRVEVFTSDPKIMHEFFIEDAITAHSRVFIGYLYQTDTQLTLSIGTAIPEEHVLKDLSDLGIKYEKHDKYSKWKVSSCIYKYYDLWMDDDE